MSAFLSQRLALVGTIDPASHAVGDVETDVVDMDRYDRVLFVVKVGTMGTAASVSFAVEQSADGEDWSAVTGKEIAPFTKLASDDDKQALVEVRQGELDTGARYVRGVLTVAEAASLADVTVLAGDARYRPTDADHLASLARVVR